MSKNEFFIDIFENLDPGSEMYISEISKSKILDHKAQKMTILWTQEVGTPILKHPVDVQFKNIRSGHSSL